MRTLAPTLAARLSENPSIRTPRTGASHALTDTLDMMGAPMSFSRNEEIYGEAEPADYLYKVVSGTVRMYRVLHDGRRQIGAFYLPGDMFGLEPGDDQHASSAEAISDVTVLVFKRSAVLALATRDNDVARQLWEMTARELHRANDHMLLLIKSAEERVASFLLEMAGCGSETDAVTLPMSRQDIADFLGLTIETVSRTITHLEHVIASPRALGMIREVYSSAVRGAIRAEVAKDLLKLPVHEIENQLFASNPVVRVPAH